MGRLKKDARQVKKAVTIFISDEELFRVKQMAQTWGTNVSQMVAHLIMLSLAHCSIAIIF